MRNFKLCDRFVAGIPTVMPGRDNAHVAWATGFFLSVIHPGMHLARNHINEGVFLAALPSDIRP